VRTSSPERLDTRHNTRLGFRCWARDAAGLQHFTSAGGGTDVAAHASAARPDRGLPGVGEALPAAIDALPHADTIHLTLGTLFHQAPGVLEIAIEGLSVLPFNLVVTCGPGVDPARFGPQPDHVLIEPYVPHALLLPRCRLVVSQGGAGIMLGALAHNLAQLMLPQGADQFINADVCTRTGVALALSPAELTAASVTAGGDSPPRGDEVHRGGLGARRRDPRHAERRRGAHRARHAARRRAGAAAGVRLGRGDAMTRRQRGVWRLSG